MYQIASSCSLKRWTYPFRSMKRICGCVEMYSTVGVRVPIWRLTILLNKWTTSFFPCKEKKKPLRRMANWLLMICKDIFALGTDVQIRHTHSHSPFGVCTNAIDTFCTHKAIAEISTSPSPHLKINPLQVCNESDEEVGVVQLLCELSHCFGLRLLVTCSAKHLLQWGQVFGHLLCNLH